MPYQLKLSQRASADINGAYAWYESQQNGLGLQFLNELQAIFIKIETHPQLFSFISKSYRKAMVKQFPYIIVFKINGEDISIYAVFHTSRNPRKKYKG